MINWEEIQDAALFGFEEAYNYGGEVKENQYKTDWEPQESEIAEALWAHYMGLS